MPKQTRTNSLAKALSYIRKRKLVIMSVHLWHRPLHSPRSGACGRAGVAETTMLRLKTIFGDELSAYLLDQQVVQKMQVVVHCDTLNK
jgi:hypothetical protein